MNSGVAAQQQLIDRVLARVGTSAITLTDVRAAVGLGLVESPPGDEAAALQRTIDRRLVLAEVARFPPAPPDEAAIAQEVAAMKARAGDDLDALLASTGLDEAKLHDLARDTLRIRTYLAQRFGTSAQVGEDEVRRYYDEHPQEFTRDGVRVPFEQAEPAARQGASNARLRATIDQWIVGLRMRAEVVVVSGT